MSLPRYPEYKDSGIEWLGEVPEHWEMRVLKHIVSTPITDGPHETPAFLDEGIPFASAESVSSGRLDFAKLRGYISKADHECYAQKYLPRRDDIFMVKSGATTGVTAIVDTDIVFNIWSPLAAIRCNSEANPRFVLNYLRSRNFLDAVTLSWSFGTQQNIGMGVIQNLAIPKPPIEEQRKIAVFLDRETAKIDALVEEQRRLIELLKEKRQAVISHAVTKGLNPDAKMKPSGIEWLGEVPEHWITCSFRHCLKEVFNGLTSDQVDESEATVPVTRIETISSGVIDEDRLGFIDIADVREDRKLVPGDILFSNINSLNMIGNCAVYLGGRDIYAGMNLLVFRPQSSISAKWLYWLVRSTIFRQAVESLSKPAINQASISQTSINAIAVPVPWATEQANIAAFLDRETAKIDALTAEANRAIDLLQERRAALISAAVIGKIDVRGERNAVQ